MNRGRFITFEGIEGSGKSTQLSRLAAWLAGKGVPVEVTREPGGTRLGATIRSLLLDPDTGTIAPEAELFLYLADRSQHVVERIEPALRLGSVVLCDRHTDATLAYQGAMRGLGVERLRELNRLATRGLVPDRTLLFDLPATAGLERAAARRSRLELKGDRIEQEPIDFHEGIRAAYLALARSEPERFVVIDATLSEEAVHERVIASIGDWLVVGRGKDSDAPR